MLVAFSVPSTQDPQMTFLLSLSSADQLYLFHPSDHIQADQVTPNPYKPQTDDFSISEMHISRFQDTILFGHNMVVISI